MAVPDQVATAQQVVDVMRELNPAQFGFLRQFEKQRIISRQPQLNPANLDGLAWAWHGALL
jgi:hypothetical protein